MNAMQISVIGVLGTLLAIQFKNGKSEYGIYICVGIGILVFYCILQKLEVYMKVLEELQSYITVNFDFMGIILKMVGITYVSEFSAAVCRDAGYQAIAGQVEVFGKLAVLGVGIPVLQSVFQMVQEFLQ